MKTTSLKTFAGNILFLLFMLASSMHVCAQQLFTKASLTRVNEQQILSFTVCREVNVFNYRIEGSNDSINFELIVSMPAKGNTMLGKTYDFKIPESFLYYRVCMVAMDADMRYSSILTVPEHKELHALPSTSMPNNAITTTTNTPSHNYN